MDNLNSVNSLKANHGITISECESKELSYIPFDIKWLPYSSKIVITGQTNSNKGIIQILNLHQGKLDLFSEYIKSSGIKCSTFGSSSFASRDLAVGDVGGNIRAYDLERGEPSFEVKRAHKAVIQSIDGNNSKGGPPEILSGSKDGSVKLWDVRMNKQAMILEQSDKHECWSVSFGNIYSYTSRVVCIGYDNGNFKLVDLRMNKTKWETNLKQGIISIEFDDKKSEMNKLAITTLENKIFFLDMKKCIDNYDNQYTDEMISNTKIFGMKFLPQKTNMFTTFEENGYLNLYKYDIDKLSLGKFNMLTNKEISPYAIKAFEWNEEKQGLASLISLDNKLTVLYVDINKAKI